MSKHFLIVIAGPTGIGKTSITSLIAKHYASPILNADSRQIYRELNIGVAKPSEIELQQNTYYFINHIGIEDAYSASKYEQEAIDLLRNIYTHSNIAILSGGTAFYIRSVLDGFDDIPHVDNSYVDELNEFYNKQGINALQNELEAMDPTYYAQVDHDNPHRLIRALAVIRASGKAFSSYLSGKKRERSFTPIKILLEMDREELYYRINLRVDHMIDSGLVEEAKSLYPQKGLKALQTVGYSELFGHFEGEPTLDKAIELIKRNSRRFAKRQMTWYRNQSGWTRFHPNQIDDILTYISKNIHQ